MGFSTIIEFNHDLCQEIIENPTVLITQITRQLASLEFNGKDIIGGQVILGCHRDDKDYKLFCDFKKKLSRD